MAAPTKKKRESKEAENAKMKELATKYRNIMLVQFENQRSSFIQELRDKIRSDSKILFGKTKILKKSIALASPLATKFSEKIQGNTFLLFTNREVEEMTNFLKENVVNGFLKAGDQCPVDVTIPKGVFRLNSEPVPADFADKLRSCQVSVEIKDGNVYLENEHKVAEKNEVVNPKQVKLLRLLGKELAQLKLSVIDNINLF